MHWENVYCVCEGRTQDGKTKCRKRITQGKGSSAVTHVENIRGTRDADYVYKEGDRLLKNCRRKLVKEVEQMEKGFVAATQQAEEKAQMQLATDKRGRWPFFENRNSEIRSK